MDQNNFQSFIPPQKDNDQDETQVESTQPRVVDVSKTSKLEILRRKPVLIGLVIGLVALLGGGAAAALVMTRGSTDKNKEADKPVANLVNDKKEVEELEAEEDQGTDPVTGANNGIELSASNNEKGTVLSWTVYNVDVSKGFKVVRSSTSSNPTFGKDEAAYVEKSSTRSYTWKSGSAGTYWYRVCAYRGNTCDNYSNAIKMDAVVKTKERVTQGIMSLSLTEDNTLHWEYTGKAVHGYKLVMSTSPNPTYPGDGYVYYGNDKFYFINMNDKPAGTYYVRVCAYTDGSEPDGTKCLNYSNQVTLVKSAGE